MSFQSADMGGISSRRMRYAVAASLLLHVLLLWPEPLRPPAHEARALLQATMRSPPPLPVPALATPAPVRPMASPTPSPAASPSSAAKPLEPPRVVSVPQTVASNAEIAPSPAPAAATAALPNMAEAQAMPQATATARAVPGGMRLVPPASGEAVDGVRGYRLAVASQARRFKRYPAEAKAAGWAGSTEVRLEVGAEGLPRPATVARSSGHEALDSAALAMIDAGAQRARLPDSLRGRGFAILLPVLFNLDEE